MVHSAVSRALFDLQALQNDDTDEQAAVPNVGPHTTITHRRGWMARESEEGRDSWEGGFGSSHKATAAQGRRTDKKRKDDRPPPDFTCTQRAHQEAPSSFLATNMGGCPHGFFLFLLQVARFLAGSRAGSAVRRRGRDGTTVPWRRRSCLCLFGAREFLLYYSLGSLVRC